MVSSISSIWFISLSQLWNLCNICCIQQSLQQYCGCWGPGAILVQRYIPHQCMHCFVVVPVLCLLFYAVALLSLQIAILDVSLPPKP